MKTKNILLLVMFMGILSFLFGCGKQFKPIDAPTENISVSDQDPTIPETESTPITPVPMPADTELTGLYLSQQGMARMPYYIMKKTATGTYMKISTLSPDDYDMWKDDEAGATEQPEEYFGYIDTVKDVEYASLVCLEDKASILQLEEIIEKYGVLDWDGFSESDPMPGVLDSGDRYDLYLELSDGTSVTVNGYNVFPNGFLDFYSDVAEVFENNSDYSRYIATDFSASPCSYLEVEIRDKEDFDVFYQLRLRTQPNQWTVYAADPAGLLLEKGTDISVSKEIDHELPFDRFLKIMSKYGVESWNQYYETDNTSNGQFDITMYFEDGKEFSAHGNIYPEGFDDFKEEFVTEVYRFYQEVQ